jgi:hypothetical protein
MDRSLSVATALIAFTTAFTALALPARMPAQAAPSVRQVRLLPNKGAVEIEIEGSDRLMPQPQVLSGPDRLVVDFPNAVPGPQLRNLAVNRGDVKDVRVGLFATKPPVTRIVFDLKGPDSYQVFPSGRTVVVKVGVDTAAEQNSAQPPGLVNASFPAQGVRITPPPTLPPTPRFRVTFENGLLTIRSDKANLSEILFAVHQRTGADIAIPSGAEQEKVAAQLGPGPAPEVLSHLLNGSSFNFLILSAEGDPHNLDRVILSPRAEGGTSAPLAPMPVQQAMQTQDADNDDSQPDPPVESVQPAPPPQRPVPVTPPDTRAPDNNDSPD